MNLPIASAFRKDPCISPAFTFFFFHFVFIDNVGFLSTYAFYKPQLSIPLEDSFSKKREKNGYLNGENDQADGMNR